MLFMARSQLARVLYDRLPRKETRVLQKKKVVRIDENEAGVTVS